MNENQSFTEGSIPKKMLGFMLPILGALILQAMYSAVDLLIVGKFGTTEGISGVATGSSIMNMVTFTVTALTTGVTVLIGKYIGEGSPDKIAGLIGSAVCFFTTLAIILSIILIVLARPITILMQAPEEAVISRAYEFLRGFAPDASLTGIGLAGPAATVFGIVLCLIYYVKQKDRWERQDS